MSHIFLNKWLWGIFGALYESYNAFALKSVGRSYKVLPRTMSSACVVTIT